MDRALQAANMRLRLLATALVALPLFAACATTDGDDGPSPYDDDYPVSEGDINAGAPANDSLPDDNKADADYPAKFEIGDQSPVQSQGSRGVCSIFSATAQIENLYIKGGMPVAEADFSEQYLQWAAKKLSGGFTNTEGSTSDVNLRTAVQYGTVKEAAWPYEPAPWTVTNDAECITGQENLPTKCYTNGEPPASIAQAEKFKLPSSRWINTNSMKAHLTTKKTGVNVGMTFFYQSWNHRKSELPVNADYWRKGYVTYPNADDKTKSLAKRAGHAIHIIGWDDDLEVEMRDAAGKPILDAAGNPRKEKGFWLFKNSWGTAGFGIEHATGAGYGWLSYKYVQEFGSAVTAEIPVLGGGGGGTGGTGGTPRSYAATPAASIPDNAPTGMTSVINVTDTGALGEVKVTVDITHTYSGDLKVSLVKGTTEKVLSANVGGSADDIKKTFTVAGLEGQALAGAWTLKIVDNAAQDTGKLNSWKLDVTTR